MASRLYQSHYSTAVDKRTIRTREALRDALLELLEVKSLDQITIRDIATKARISYVTFFRHHKTKDSLMQDIAADQVKRLAGLMLPALDASDTLAASTALCVYVDYHRKLWSTLLTGGAASVMKEEFLRNSNELASRSGHPNNWLPRELAVSLNVSSTIEVLTWWLRQKTPVPISRVAEIHEQTVIRPIIEAASRSLPSKAVKAARPAKVVQRLKRAKQRLYG